MKAPQDIILRPVITEASMAVIQAKQYTFSVAKDANKIAIGLAVEALFPGTKVRKVNTINVRGRAKRMGRTQGTTPAWKKAVVTLTEDSKTIEFFESML